jgi:hypothetical protein
MTELNQTIKHPFKVICVDAASISDKIDDDQLIQEGHEYIVTNIFTNLIGDGGDSFKLLGIDPEPFKGYGAYRFRAAKGSYFPYLTSIN